MAECHDSWSERRVLVTGAGGFIGARLVDSLEDAGAVVCAVHRALPDGGASSARVSRIACDLRDPVAIRAAMAAFRPEIVIHLASRPDAAETREHAGACLHENPATTLNVLDAAALAGARGFVYGDSAKVFGVAPAPWTEETVPEPRSSYAISKLAGWHVCKMYAHMGRLQVVAVRPGLVYGPGQGHNLIGYIFRQLEQGVREIVLDGGSQTRDPVYIDDVVDAYRLAALRLPAVAGRALNVSGGNELSVASLAERIVTATGRAARVVPCPERMRPTEVPRMVGDIAATCAALGWSPRVGLGEGLARTVVFLRGPAEAARSIAA